MTDAIHRLARAALRRWDVTDCEPQLLKRRENHVFTVRTVQGGKAVLRVHRPGYHTDRALQSELQWLVHLHTSGLPVPKPLPDTEGNLFVRETDDGSREPMRVDMLTWLPGEVLGESGTPLAWSAVRIPQIFRALGAAMAELHDASDRWQPPADFTRHAWDTDGLLGEQPFWGRFWESEALERRQRDLLQRVRERLRDDLNEYASAGGDFGLIHSDLVRDNVLVNDSGVALVDFDDGGFGWRAFDIAVALIRNREERDYAAIETALIEGYRSRRELAEIDRRMLPAFTLLRSCAYVGWVSARINEPGMRAPMQQRIDETCALAEAYLEHTSSGFHDATRQSHG